MNIRELIDQLEDLAASYPDAEVRLASQPAWPFENEIANVTLVEMTDRCQECDGDGVMPEGHPREGKICNKCGETGQTQTGEVLVYITEGRQIGYLPSTACQEIGWK